MPLQEAIDAIKGQLAPTQAVMRPDVSVYGQVPTAAVYRAGMRQNAHNELVHYVVVDLHVPMAATYVEDEDIEAVYAQAQAVLEYLATNRPGGMFVWWGEPPTATFDFEKEASCHIEIGLCDRYPRS